jgi:hypothetical protein
MDDSAEDEWPGFKHAGLSFSLSSYCRPFYALSISVVSVGEDRMISLGGHGENEG